MNNNNNNEDIEAMRNYVRSLFNEDLTDEQLDALIESGEIEVKLFNFDKKTKAKIDKILEDPNVSEEVMQQQINYLMHHGQHTPISKMCGVEMFEVSEKKFSDDDTSDVDPISPEEFNRLMGL